MDVSVGAAGWAVGKALAPVLDGFLESWAASSGLGNNVDAIKLELLYAQGMLQSAQAWDIHNIALKELVHKLQQLAYRADDALDELEYFRIQDPVPLDDGGFIRGLALNARHTARGMANKLKLPSCSCAAIRGAPKLKFNRVEMSTKIVEIIKELKPVRAAVSTILNLEMLGSSRAPSHGNAMNRPKTTPDIIEPTLYGRDDEKRRIVDDIVNVKSRAGELTVLPIVGPGGIGKTTFTQHIYEEVRSHFQVPIWVCVSLTFSASKLAQEIVGKLPEVGGETSQKKKEVDGETSQKKKEVDGEKANSSDEELIEQRLRSKSFLLVLDDVWTHDEDEWRKLIKPFERVGKGNMVIVTTRIPKVANMVCKHCSLVDLGSLDDSTSMSFLEACVFGKEKPWKDCENLVDVGNKIVPLLKGSPLAIKTVGRLLRNELSLDYWNGVLESKEWESLKNASGIMPALKLSYDYLPFHLQQCFFYCALFPEDYEFDSNELVRLWIGLRILHSSDENKGFEDVGLYYLTELVNYGFFKKNEKEDGSPCYVIHDLLHELAVNVSSYECLSIHSSNVRSIQIPPSVRHLSIIVDDKDVKDRTTFQDYDRDLRALDKRLNVGNLHTLMLFGLYHGNFAKAFGYLFPEAKALRTIFLSGASYSMEDVLQNFSKTIHLRYLRIKSEGAVDIGLPRVLFRLYHLEVIDLEEWKGPLDSIRDVTNLVKLRYFVAPTHTRLNLYASTSSSPSPMNSSRSCCFMGVGKGNTGFDLSQLGQLTELRGTLAIYNLEKVQEKEETNELKPIHRNHLHKLTLEWDSRRTEDEDPAREANVLESLVPHSNLKDLCIRGHGGRKCPTWLGDNLSIEYLESLHLADLSWKDFPPLGELWFVDESGKEYQACISSQSFQNLKRLKLVGIPKLTKWVGSITCQLFSYLEVIIIEDCPELVDLPFSYSTCYPPEQGGAYMIWFPRLRELKIERCPKLRSLRPIPWSRALRSIGIRETGLSFKCLSYSGRSLYIDGGGATDSLFWNDLVFYNLSDLKDLTISDCPPLTSDHIRMLTSLQKLTIFGGSSIVLSPIGGEYQLPVEKLSIDSSGVSGKEVTQLLSHFPKLIDLTIRGCENITELGAVEQQQQRREEEEIAAAADGKGRLLLPTQLQELEFGRCPDLSILPNSGGLQRLRSLRAATAYECPRLLSSYPCSSSSCFPFPSSLETLRLRGMETLGPLSNLTSLTKLVIHLNEEVEPISVEEALLRLTSLQSIVFDQNVPLPPARLYWLREIMIFRCHAIKSLPKDYLPSSLQILRFDDCSKFESLPKDSLPSSLQELHIYHCPALKSLPKDSLPSSLQELDIRRCPALQSLPGLPSSLKKLKLWDTSIKSMPKDGLPSSLQELDIYRCPALKSLPMDGLIRSLRVLDVHWGNSEELKRQCRKFTGKIPIIRA